MQGAYGWLKMKLIRWSTRSPEQQFRAVANALVDTILFTFLLGVVWVGINRDVFAFAFWVPFLGVACYFRAKQAMRRWAL